MAEVALRRAISRLQEMEVSRLLIRRKFMSKSKAQMNSELWEDFFSDPSKWWDYRLEKRNPNYPDFKHKRTREALWEQHQLNPSWVALELGAVSQQLVSNGVVVCEGRPYDRDIGLLCKFGKLTEALQTLCRMNEDGIVAIPATYARLAQECGKKKAFREGRYVHDFIVRSGWESNRYLQRHLISMYASCDRMVEARQVFSKMTTRNVFAWAALIRGYVANGRCREALNSFQQMVSEGSDPNKSVFISVLSACARLAALEQGREVHSLLLESSYAEDTAVGNYLMDMYVKCGSMKDALRVFNGMGKRDVVSWNTLISAYTSRQMGHEAFKLLEDMLDEGATPDSVTFVSVLKSCTESATMKDAGRRVHGLILGTEYESDVHVGTALINMYFRFGSPDEALKVFETLPKQSIVPWSAMIKGYAQHGYGQEALKLFEELQHEDVRLDKICFLCVLRACASSKYLEEGRKVHAQIVKRGFESDNHVACALITMYAKCGSVEEAQELFENMSKRDISSYNAMLTAYTKFGLHKQALDLFESMQQQGEELDKLTFLLVFGACAGGSFSEAGRQAHTLFISSGLSSDIIVDNSLLVMYAKCGRMEDAQNVFNAMEKRDVISWTTMIKAFIELGQVEMAIRLFHQLQKQGMKVDRLFYVSVLQACATAVALKEGREVHEYAGKDGFDGDIVVANALLNFYVKCGRLDYAHQVFRTMPSHDVISWSSMMSGHIQQGQFVEALQLFQEMQSKGVKPNQVIFLCSLQACGGLGDIEKGRSIHRIIQEFGYEQEISVGHALIDMYTKCGSKEDARQVPIGCPNRTLSLGTKLFQDVCNNRITSLIDFKNEC